jgi:hypothetical protein
MLSRAITNVYKLSALCSVLRALHTCLVRGPRLRSSQLPSWSCLRIRSDFCHRLFAIANTNYATLLIREHSLNIKVLPTIVGYDGALAEGIEI